MTDRFHAFSTSHFVVLGLAVAGAGAVVWSGSRIRGTKAELPVRRTFALVIVAVALAVQLLQLLPGRHWSLTTSLPLQLCDLAAATASYALWTRRPWAAALTYYCGLTLTTQAMITPDLLQPFPSPRFIEFWATHTLVVWAALFLTFGLGIHPDWRRFRQSVALTFAYAVAIIVFNFGIGANYGYLNRKPDSASVLDVMGPWPGYVVVEIVVVVAAWALITLPWVTGRRRPVAKGNSCS